MNNTTTEHPTRNELQLFYDGALSKLEDAERVASHLDRCQECLDWFDGLAKEEQVLTRAVTKLVTARRNRATIYKACAVAVVLAAGVVFGMLVGRTHGPAGTGNQVALERPVADVIAKHLDNTPDPTRLALVIGVPYPLSSRERSFADKDADRFAMWLQASQGVPQTQLKQPKDATVAEIRAQMQWLSQRACQDDSAYLYVSGFAQRGPDGQLLFCAHDGLLPMKELLTAFGNLPCQRKIAVIDTCYAGQAMEELLHSVSGPLAVRDRFGGMVVITACRPEQKSWNDANEAWQSSIFSRVLLEGLDGGLCGNVTAADLRDYLTRRFRGLDLQEAQTPEVYGEAVVAELPLKLTLVDPDGRLVPGSVSVDGVPLKVPPRVRADGNGGQEIDFSLPMSDKAYWIGAHDESGELWGATVRLDHKDPVQRITVVPRKARAAKTEIQITRISANGQTISGKVRGLTGRESEWGVQVYVHSDRFYKHRVFGQPLAEIRDGQWQVDFERRGHEKDVLAVVVPRGTWLPDTAGDLEEFAGAVKCAVPYQSEYEAKTSNP